MVVFPIHFFGSVEVINDAKNSEYFKEVASRIRRLEAEVSLVESRTRFIVYPKDLFSCSEYLLKNYNDIGEAIHLIQGLSILSSRVVGIEIGSLRLRLPKTWKDLRFSIGRSWRANELKFLVQSLTAIVERCAHIQQFLEVFHSKHGIRLMELSQQLFKLNGEILDDLSRNLTKARDSLLILRNLIEWDYRHRFTIGESAEPGDEPRPRKGGGHAKKRNSVFETSFRNTKDCFIQVDSMSGNGVSYAKKSHHLLLNFPRRIKFRRVVFICLVTIAFAWLVIDLL